MSNLSPFTDYELEVSGVSDLGEGLSGRKTFRTLEAGIVNAFGSGVTGPVAKLMQLRAWPKDIFLNEVCCVGRVDIQIEI